MDVCRLCRSFLLVALGLSCLAAATHAEQTVYNGTDGHGYVLVSGLPGDLRTFEDAKSYCNGVSQAGKPSVLSPYNAAAIGDSINAIKNLCMANRLTCWLGEDSHSSGDERLCPMLSQEGDKYFQGCLQIMSFVCRSQDPIPGLSVTPPPQDREDLPALDGPAQQLSYNGLDERVYTLFFIGNTRDFPDAAAYCAAAGLELAPYNTGLLAGDALFSVNFLCSRTSKTTCWVDEPQQGGLCAILSQEGALHYQDCAQQVAFVCRTVMPGAGGYDSDAGKAETTSPDPLPTPVVEADMTASDGRHYTLYSGPYASRRTHRAALEHCMSLGQELAPFYNPDGSHPDPAYAQYSHPDATYPGATVAAVRELCVSRRLTCWLHMPSVQGLCPIASQEGSFYYQGCDQLVSWVCRTISPVAPATTPTGPTPQPQPLPQVPAERTYAGDDRRTYILYNGDAPNRRTYDAAVRFCFDAGMELAFFDPLNYAVSSNAVRALCGGFKTTCWVAGPACVDALCPMVSQEADLHFQTRTQEINFVCRTAATSVGPTYTPQNARRMLA